LNNIVVSNGKISGHCKIVYLEDKCLLYERNGFISARDMYSFVKLLRYRDTE